MNIYACPYGSIRIINKSSVSWHYLTKATSVVGRAYKTTSGDLTGVDIPLGHACVSRNHVRFEVSGDACGVKDLESAVGTYVDGEFLRKTERMINLSSGKSEVQIWLTVDGAERVSMVWFAGRDSPCSPTPLVSRQSVTDEALLEIYRSIDVDGHGSIDAAELRGMTHRLGFIVSMTEISNMMKHVDKDGDGTIDFSEFKAFVKQLAGPVNPSLQEVGAQWVQLASSSGGGARGGAATASTKSPLTKKRKAQTFGGSSDGADHPSVEGLQEMAAFKPAPDYDDAHAEAPYVRVAGTIWGSAGQPSSNDLKQGSLNNCYFVAALGVLADEFPDAVMDAFKPFDVQGSAKVPESLEAVGQTWAVTFKLPSRKSRHSSQGGQGTETVLVDERFYVEPGKKRARPNAPAAAAAAAAAVATRDAGQGDDDKRPPLARGGGNGALDLAASAENTIYMRSSTMALWPLLLEKAWVSLLGGTSYGDICPEDSVRCSLETHFGSTT